MSEALLRASGISVSRNGRLTLEPSDFAVRAGETVAIYGPNGAGKSTLLQALAGLLPLASGTITLGGQVVGRDLTPFAYHRRTAAVFQEPLLLRGTVSHNVGLGLALRGIRRAEREARVGPVLEQLKIAHLADRAIGMLSGGEAQRVSLARALVLDPDLLFLDEPFAALDQPTRRRLVHELADVLSARRMATVFVTHDLAEASALCDSCVIIDAGAIVQAGPMPELLELPRTRRVAEIVGFENIWDVKVGDLGTDGSATVEWRGCSLTASPVLSVGRGSRASVVARAESLHLATDSDGGVQRMEGRVLRLRRLARGAIATVEILGAESIDVYCPPSQRVNLGDCVDVAMPPRSLLLVR